MGQKQLFKDILTKNFKKLERKNRISHLRSFMNPKQEHPPPPHHTHSYITIKLLKTKKKDQTEIGKILKQPGVGGDILPSKEQKSD